MLFEFDKFMNTAGITNNKTNSNLYTLEEGFIKGNMFENLYDPYKHYEPKKIIPKNEKETLLLSIYKLSFAINDLNLYLDINPKDQRMYETFKELLIKYENCLCEYEEKYGTIELTHDMYNKYTWINSPWPWEGTYV